MFRETPPSYNFSWHNAPRRQYIVNLDADVEITVSSGETRVIRQGEVFFVEDTHGELCSVYCSTGKQGLKDGTVFLPLHSVLGIPEDSVFLGYIRHSGS